MKKLDIAFTFSTVLGAIAGCLSGCNDPNTAHNVTTAVLTTEEVVCALNHAELDNAAIAKACSIADTLLPAITAVVGAHKNGVGVPPQAGCPKLQVAGAAR